MTVVNVSQEQKEMIEKMGYSVVQVKAAIQKLRDAFLELGRKIARYVEKLQKLQKLISPDELGKVEPRGRYKIVKQFGLNHNVYFNHKGFYRCRNNC